MKYLSLPMLSQKIFLLPGGKARLRVFETRCLKAISLVAESEGLLLRLPLNENLSESNNKEKVDKEYLGSLVVIEDFNQGEDGVLELDVLCRSLVDIQQIKSGENQDLIADVKIIKHWSQEMRDISEATNIVATSLNELISQDNMLNSLYQHRVLNDSHWVIARWLELLPVNLQVKRSFINKNGFMQAKVFIESIIF